MSVEIKIIRKATKHEEEEVIKHWDIENGYVSESLYPRPGDMMQVHSSHLSTNDMYKVLSVVHYFDDSTEFGPVDEIRVYVKKIKSNKKESTKPKEDDKKPSANVYEDALNIARGAKSRVIESEYHKMLADLLTVSIKDGILDLDDTKHKWNPNPQLERSAYTPVRPTPISEMKITDDDYEAVCNFYKYD